MLTSARRLGGAVLLGALCTWAAPVHAAFGDLENEVVEFTLDNGLTFLILERHTAPVFSYCTMVNAGGVDEVPGVTGVAHMFEHMAFKGTHTIGVTDFKKEKKALAEVDAAFDAWLTEWREGALADPDRLAELEAQLDEAETAAREYVVTNEFTEILETNGVPDLNAQTGLDWTRYFYSLPSNRLELWALMEGDRLTNPVLREFNTERDVVLEERRMRYESSPIGRLQGHFMALAFPVHPYGDGAIGHRSDLESFTRADAQAFFDTYYVASNITIAVVGDVTPDEVRRLAEKYFSKVPQGPEPTRVDTLEPPQVGERRLLIEDPAQPVVMLGYPIPEARHPDWVAYQLLASAVGQGRSSRLYTRLVKEQGTAAQIVSFVGFPGEKYANLFGVFSLVAAGQDPFAVEISILETLERDLQENPITQEELDGARARYKANIIRSLRSNSGLAQNLTYAQVVYGDWRKLFQVEPLIDAVTVEDLSRVAGETFRRSNRNVGMIVPPETES